MAEKTIDFMAALREKEKARGKPAAPKWAKPGVRDALPATMLDMLPASRTGENPDRNIATMDLDRRTEGFYLVRPVFPEAQLVAKAGGYTARFAFKRLDDDGALVCERSVNGRDATVLRIIPGRIELLWEGRLRDGRGFSLELQRVPHDHYAQGALGNVRIIVNKGEPVSEGPVNA